MSKVDKHIFLTGREILIKNSYQLSIHLKRGDSRADALLRNKKGDIYFIVYNPSIKWNGTFSPDKWYIIPKSNYLGETLTKDYVNLSFSWRYKYKVENPSRELTKTEVDFFRKKNYL